MTVHVIHFTGPIHQPTANLIQEQSLMALKQGATSIRYHLSTEGGSTFHGFTLYNFIRSLPVPTVMCNVGSVQSMGIILYLAADTRIAAPHSRFLLHPMNWNYGGAGSVDHARLIEHTTSLNDEVQRYVDIFNERTNGGIEPVDVVSCLQNTSRILTAEAATAANLATSIADIELPADAITWWINS
jgi:ATP-dependent protease ClpP protease subunit